MATALGVDDLTASDLLRVMSRPGFERLREQMRRTGGCSDPVHLMGETTTTDRAGRTLHTWSTREEPGATLRVACGNRRSSRCPSCASMYAADTFHLIRAGLSGDVRKHVPTTVRAHPRVFATLTAPSFGPVHNRPDSGRCRCGATHPEDAPELGTALDPGRYDYGGAVLWNNHAGHLWARFAVYLRRELGSRAGLNRAEFRQAAKLSFAKVAEFQKRGAVHFHAVVRLDGPDGPDTEPPAWATVALLDDAIRAAAARVRLEVPATDLGHPARTLAWGAQVDVRPIASGFEDGTDITEEGVAAYVAKYATKAAEIAGGLDRRIGERAELTLLQVPEHTRRLIEACWELDDAYPERMLAHWSHMLGFRGHFSTKSRAYSTTLGALRKVRADFRATQQRRSLGLPDPAAADGAGDSEGSTLVVAHWEYAGHGHTPGESWLAATVAHDIRTNRETAREALADLATDQEEGEDWS
ncbi:replication initiation protein [Streptomyces sp. SID3343]|nr:replication initiation protein [Streptomyces sp. SID3343]